MNLRIARPPQTCLRCGAAFHAKPAHIANGGAKFCSPSCYWGPRAEVTCAQCGVRFTSRPSADARFCSRRCVDASHRIPPEERFWKHVDRTGDCWLWTAQCVGPYGRFVVSHGQPVGAHRYSWELHFGPIPQGMFVCHKCDNPRCVNPAHLFVGTPSDNTADMMKKGRRVAPAVIRRPRGEGHAMAKLADADVLNIRAMRLAGVPRHEVAERFGIHPHTVTAITARRIWKHI